MNFLGMGPLEILILLLVAFIFLGPERMIDTSRALGKLMKDLGRVSSEISDIALEEEAPKFSETSNRQEHNIPKQAPNDKEQLNTRHETDITEDGPVPFQQAKEVLVQDTAKPPSKQEET